MARLWYPEKFHVQVVAHKLAEQFFSDYDSPMPPFVLFGGQREGGALLESALALPRQSFGGRYLYKAWHDKAGVLLRSLIKNHPLIDGNKRIALATTFVFLLMNGRVLLVENEEMVNFALAVAASEPDMPWRNIARWIAERTVHIADIENLMAKARESYPHLVPEMESLRQLVSPWSDWAEEGQRLERDLLREARRVGLSRNEVFAALAEQFS